MKPKKYKYPKSDKIFVLKNVAPNGNVYFQCGHWCTNNVFVDLIDLDTGFSKRNNPQKSLF